MNVSYAVKLFVCAYLDRFFCSFPILWYLVSVHGLGAEHFLLTKKIDLIFKLGESNTKKKYLQRRMVQDKVLIFLLSF